MKISLRKNRISMNFYSRTWAFCFSKLPELIDTVFIVLRKQPLIFLHWYHHASVLVYCWFSYQDYSSTGRYIKS